MNFGRILQFTGMTMLPSALVIGLTQQNAVRQELTLAFVGSMIFLAGTYWTKRRS